MSKHETDLQNEREYEEFIDSCEELDEVMQGCLQSVGLKPASVFFAVMTKILINLARRTGTSKEKLIYVIARSYDEEDEDDFNWQIRGEFH